MLCSIFVHLKGLRSKKVHARGKKQSRCHSQNNLKKDFPPCFSQSVITCKCHDHLSPARRRVQITQAWFCASQQGVSGKRNQGRYVQREEWHYCLRLVAECRILLTFGIWRRIKLAATQGLAPAFDTPGQGGAWTTLRLMHLSPNTDTRGLKFQFCDIYLKLMTVIGRSSVTLSFCCRSWRRKMQRCNSWYIYSRTRLKYRNFAGVFPFNAISASKLNWIVLHLMFGKEETENTSSCRFTSTCRRTFNFYLFPGDGTRF